MALVLYIFSTETKSKGLTITLGLIMNQKSSSVLVNLSEAIVFPISLFERWLLNLPDL